MFEYWAVLKLESWFLDVRGDGAGGADLTLASGDPVGPCRFSLWMSLASWLLGVCVDWCGEEEDEEEEGERTTGGSDLDAAAASELIGGGGP